MTEELAERIGLKNDMPAIFSTRDKSSIATDVSSPRTDAGHENYPITFIIDTDIH